VGWGITEDVPYKYKGKPLSVRGAKKIEEVKVTGNTKPKTKRINHKNRNKKKKTKEQKGGEAKSREGNLSFSQNSSNEY